MKNVAVKQKLWQLNYEAKMMGLVLWLTEFWGYFAVNTPEDFIVKPNKHTVLLFIF